MLPYIEPGLRFAQITEAYPQRTIATHLYIDFETFQGIPKTEKHKVFFVLRDPRDIVVSWYFSAKYSHPIKHDPIPRWRAGLQGLSQQEGFRYIIDELQEIGSFQAQRSWMNRGVRLFRYEDLAQSEESFARTLLNFLEIPIEGHEFRALMRRHRFKKKSGGRERGEENQNSHFRKGIAGDWKNYLDQKTLEYFHIVTGDLLNVLGYD